MSQKTWCGPKNMKHHAQAGQVRAENCGGRFDLGCSGPDANLPLMSNSADALRRWLGLFCLAVAAGLLIWGQTILKPVLNGLSFIFYWGICFIFTFAAIVIAMLDMRAVRQRTRREQAELIQKTLEKMDEESRHLRKDE